MKKNKFLDTALNCLSKSEKDIIFLLQNKDASKEDILKFLETYNIDKEKAPNTFLLNELVERYDLQNDDNNIIPRIKGLKDYYRFHNISVINSLQSNSIIYDIDLCLRLIHKDNIRAFATRSVFMSKETLTSYLGKKYVKKLESFLEEITYNNKIFLVPGKKYLIDLIYLNVSLCSIHSNPSFNYACLVYDLYRYTNNEPISREINSFITRKKIRHFFGKIKRKIFKK